MTFVEVNNIVCRLFEFAPVLLALGCMCLYVLLLLSLRWKKNKSQDTDSLQTREHGFCKCINCEGLVK